MKTIKEQTKRNAFYIFIFGAACAVASQLVGCGGPQGPQGPAGATIVVAPSPAPDAITTVVNGYNEYLVSQGSDPIQPGLKCTLYNVPNMPANPCLSSSTISGCSVISSSSGYTAVGSFTYTGQINQSDQAGTLGFNLLPQALQGLYSQNFAVTCTGYFVNPDYNYHEFDVASDDGSMLWIGSALVVSNDGIHSIKDVTGEKYLEAQVYSLTLEYFQGPGNVALVVNEDGQLMSAESLWH
jgi:hypothetical protein